MVVAAPVSERRTVIGLLLLTFATGLIDAISVLVLGHVFVATMAGNVIFLGFWFVPHSGVDLTTGVVVFAGFLVGTVLGGRFARHLDYEVRRWLTAGLAIAFGPQNATARQYGIQELSTTVLTSTIVGIGVGSRLAGRTGNREKLRYGVVATMLGGAIVGATLSRFAVAPVIALAALAVAISAAIFRFGPTVPEPARD
jgi:uncharacterized membrane protein YoaK (UPF0700 family)